jgi:hypothetical protein
MENKYYTPQIEEFHVGFNCEWKMQRVKSQSFLNNDYIHNWSAHTITIDDFSDHALADESHNLTYNLNEWRVKYIDREDIESFGFIREFSTFSKILKSPAEVYINEEKNTILAHYPDINKVTISTRDYAKNELALKSNWDDRQVNLISIKNKNELQRLLKQLSIIN